MVGPLQKELLYSLIGFPSETEWLEFKEGSNELTFKGGTHGNIAMSTPLNNASQGEFTGAFISTGWGEGTNDYEAWQGAR